MTKSDRLIYIEGLRGLAIGVVLVFHASTWAGILDGHAYRAFYVGSLGVDLFFVISGFCMAWPQFVGGGLRQLEPRAFYWRRFRRIWPPYAVAVVAAIIASFAIWRGIGPHWWGRGNQSTFPDSAPSFVGNVVSHLTLTHGFVQRYDRSTDAAFWSLSTEAQFYLLLPLIVLVARRFGMVVAVAGMAAVSVGYVVAVHMVNAGFLDSAVGGDVVLFRLIEFGAGMLAAWLVATGRGRVPHGWLVAVLVALVAAVAIDGRVAPRPFAAAVAFGVLVIWGARSRIGARALSVAPLRALGRVSYSAYLIHDTVFASLAIPLTYLTLGLSTRIAIYALIGLPLAVGAAVVLHRLVELPAVRWSHMRATDESRPAAVPTNAR